MAAEQEMELELEMVPSSEEATNPMLMARNLGHETLNIGAVISQLRKAWGEGFTFTDVAANTFLCTAPSQKASQTVMEQSPWSIMDKLIITKEWLPQYRFIDLDMHHVAMWVQIHDLPLQFISSEHAKAIGAKLGKVVEVENPRVDGGIRRIFLRVRVELDINCPLKTGIWIPRKDMEKIWARFQYEGLNHLCYSCGILGHEQQDCLQPRQDTSSLDDKRFGPWLSTEPAVNVKLLSPASVISHMEIQNTTITQNDRTEKEDNAPRQVEVATAALSMQSQQSPETRSKGLLKDRDEERGKHDSLTDPLPLKVNQVLAQDMASSFGVISPEGCPKKYDVFVSFRGEDTRKNFTSHLHAALCQKNLVAYIDNRLDKGDEISPALIMAIKESYTSLIIFSENYASSKWCLDELIEIIECKKSGQVVIPVFYNIDPSHVRKQLGSYENAFAKHEQHLRHNIDNVLKWKIVLTEAASLAGFDSLHYGTDHELIEEIVKKVQKKVHRLYPNNEFKDLVGFHQNFAQMERLLTINSNHVRIIGIWGMGGIGKTMLAKALFAKYSSQYEGSCFLKGVRGKSKTYGLDYLHSKVISKLLEEDNDEICTSGAMSSFSKRRLSSKKVFIVLDDVNSLEQLECLVQKDSLGLGSRVILTTRDRDVFSGGIDGFHEVKKLNFEESLQLFNLHAFNKRNSKVHFEKLSIRIVNYAKGVPLALKVLGSFLRRKSKEEWDNFLRQLKKCSNEKIQSVLRLSYDSLNYNEKEIFLDIAFFMKGWDKNDVKRILDACGFFADIGMRNLEDKALITISYDKVEMHNLIQEMAWEIVHEESIKDPKRCSRLRDSEEIYHVLRYNRGTEAIEGILFDAYEIGDLHLESNVFKGMINLRFLKFNGQRSKKFNLYIPSGLDSLPSNLRYLGWSGYPLKSLPSTFHPEKLVKLWMPESRVEKLWDGVQNLANLEEIVLSWSLNLLELPDLSRATNLKYMYLIDCRGLRDVHPSILSLPKLEKLLLTYSKALKSLNILPNGFSKSPNLPGYYQCELPTPSIMLDSLSNLRVLELDGCTLSELPDNINQLVSLRYLILDESHLVRLPKSIKHLSQLRYLGLWECKKLQSLLELPPSITFLDARNCTSLEILSGPSKPPKKYTNAVFLFENCSKLGRHAREVIMADALIRIRVAANYLLSALAIEKREQEKDAETYGEEYGKICFCLPGSKLPAWFSYCSTQPSLMIEIPSRFKVLGFAFYVIIHKDGIMGEPVNLG